MAMMNELYASVYEKLKAVQTKYENAENQLQASKEQDEVAKQKRIENLQLQLKKIDEYEEKVGYFKQMAEKHMVSKNLLTITPRELNFNRLRNWAMMIDPSEPDDPYAQRIYVQAKCNERFLERKKTEFQRTLSELTEEGGTTDQELEKAVASIKAQLVEECRAIIESEAFDQLAAAVSQRHERYLNMVIYASGLAVEYDIRKSVTEEDLRKSRVLNYSNGMISNIRRDRFTVDSKLCPVRSPDYSKLIIAQMCCAKLLCQKNSLARDIYCDKGQESLPAPDGQAAP